LHGIARIGFAARDSHSRLATLYQQAPLRVLFPRAPEGDPPHAVLVTTSGGLVGGDRIEVAVETGPAARALVTSQAAEKAYRSTGAPAQVTISLRAGADAWLEWCPQETILFEGARLHRTTSLQLDPSARALAGEMVVFGRRAHGERLRTGSLRDAWRLHGDDRLIWADALRLEGDIAARLAAPFGCADASACATRVYAAADAATGLEYARDLVSSPAPDQRAGVTCLPGLLLCRWLGRDAALIRTAFVRAWIGLRHAVAGLPAAAPVTWNC
jgi:urease accessory protein